MRRQRLYTEAFKLHVLEEIAEGKWASPYVAAKAYRVSSVSVYLWLEKYGYGHLINRRVIVSKPEEQDELKKLRRENRQLRDALADKTVEVLLEREFFRIACRKGGVDPEVIKKKSGMLAPGP
jgi:transposase-like protein